MNPLRRGQLARVWTQVGPRFLPFADAAGGDLSLARLLRLSLFQVSVGMATALLIGTLNRVMIVEMQMSAALVSLMVALPLVVAPLRALIGFRSDVHRSVLGWRRVPYLWMGTLLQFGGLAIMPFALILMSGDRVGPEWVGHAGAALAFLLVGAGLQTTQTAGLALATDLAQPARRPRVVALMYVMHLVGMGGAALGFSFLLADFSAMRLIQVVQGAAMVTVALNLLALWKQEPRGRPGVQVGGNTASGGGKEAAPSFAAAWRHLATRQRARRFLLALGLGTAAFSMQDIILEPYGGEILGMGVAETTSLTAMMAGGALLAFALAARWLGRGGDPFRIAAIGSLVGLFAFSAVIFAQPLSSALLYRAGGGLIGFGGGLFAVAMLTAAMSLDTGGLHGLAVGAWGAVQASAAGLAIALGGGIRDAVSSLAEAGLLGSALVHPATGYSFVYHIELYLLFATLVAIGPLVRRGPATSGNPTDNDRFGLAEMPV